MKPLERIALFSTTCLVAIFISLPVDAADNTGAAKTARRPGRTPAASHAGGQENIIVTGSSGGSHAGGGLIKAETAPASISTISRDFISKQASLTNPYALVSILPGASVSSSDPYGVQTPDMSVRGLGSAEIGFLWEGMPLNDVGNYLGYPDEWFASEDLLEVSLKQGSSGIADPLMNNSGGVVSMSFVAPTDKAGAYADASYGSYHTSREFIRVNTGDIGNTGIKAWGSFYYLHAPDWRGSGLTTKTHLDFDIVDNFANGSNISFLGSWNHEDQTFATLPTLDDWHQYGRSFNYDGTYTNGDINYWKLYQAPYDHLMLNAPAKLVINRQLDIDVDGYLWYGKGLGSGGTYLNNAGNYLGTEFVPGSLGVTTGQVPGGQFAAFASYANDQYRPGVVAKVNYHLGHHRLVAGYWYDYSSDRDTQGFTALGEDGLPSSNSGTRYTIEVPDGRQLLAQSILTKTETNGIFVADTAKYFNDRLTLDAGFKEVMISRNGTNYLPGSQYKTNLNDSAPLPTLAASFQFDSHHQIFANVTTHFRTPVSLALYDSYSPTFGQYGVKANNLKHEYSIAEEFGYRYSDSLLIASATFFNYNFSNRQLSSVIIQNGVQVSSYLNAGGQTTRGVDIELGLHPHHHVSPYFSAEYLNSHIDNDIQVGGDYLPTKGKHSIESPPFTIGAGLSYDDSRIFGNVVFKYKGYQYSTFMNDERIPGYPSADMAIGYRLHDLIPVVHPEIKLNLINIGDVKYLSGVASPTTNARTTTGLFGTSISGSSPLYYEGGGFAAVITLSASL